MNAHAQAEFDFEARKEEVKQASAAMIERIKKLLRLAADQRGNRHEAERALALAYELAEKHRVDVAALDLDEKTEVMLHEQWQIGMRFDRLRRGVCGILQTFFHVTVLISKPRLIVIGKPTDVLIARYVHDFLLRAGRDCLKTFEQEQKRLRRRMSKAKREGFTTGFIWGLSAMLRAGRATAGLPEADGALVVKESAERDAYAATLGKIAELPALPDGRRNESALTSGYRAGKATTINQPLAGSAGGPLLLT